MACSFYVTRLVFTFFVYILCPSLQANMVAGFPQECFYCHDNNQKIPYIFASFEAFKAKQIRYNNCRDCHANNYVLSKQKKHLWYNPLSHAALQNISKRHSYIYTPRLQFVVSVNRQEFDRYTRCGLSSFLQTPVSRQPPYLGSMFSLSKKRIVEIIDSNSDKLEDCETYQVRSSDLLSGSMVKKSESYFNAHCQYCHNRGLGSKAPLLRIGTALLSYEYFKARVKHGVKEREGFLIREPIMHPGDLSVAMQSNSFMPKFHLEEEALLQLYRYISLDDTDRATIAPEKRVIASNQAYFEDVINNVFRSGCQHCHSPDQSTFASVKAIFSIDNTIPIFPYGKEMDHVNREEFNRISSIGPDCQPSVIVKKLLDRHSEWAGRYDKKLVSGLGMPVTLPPVDIWKIKMLNLWSKNHCQSPSGFLCENRCKKKEYYEDF